MAKTHIAVIGGGITGQLVQMQIPSANLYDWQSHRATRTLTRNLGANYLWEPIPGLDHKAFPVITHVDGCPATQESVVRYKTKIGKSGDVENWERQFTTRMVGYDFISLPEPRVHYDHRIVSIDAPAHTMHFAKYGDLQYDILVSTIPLYSLLSLLGMREPAGRLQFKPIYFKISARPPDAPFPVTTMYVNYISNPDIDPYRFCDRFGERHYESIKPFPGVLRRYAPGKIYPHEGVPDVLDTLASMDIYTFGRFGSWNPDELVHETWHNIETWRDIHARV